MRDFWFKAWENLIYIFVGIIFLNMLILNYIVFFGKPKQIVQNINLGGTNSAKNTTTTASGQVIQSAQPQTQVIDACPNTCMTAIKTATASLKLTQNVVNNTPTTQQQASSGSNEYFVPFGGAEGASQGSYSTLPALQAYVNMSQYTNVQTVVFETSVSASGIVQLQLYDATDGYVIPNSQVTSQGGTPQFLISAPLTLPAGNKLYQVQIQTQLSSQAIVNSARLHITLQ